MHIYKWTHVKTNRSYIGQSIQDPNRRRLEHLANSRYSKKTYHFHNALKKYRVEEFSWEVIAYAKSIEELNQLEEYFIKKYNSIENGFNIRNGGKNKTHSDESKKRMSEAQTKAHERRRKLGTEGGWKRIDGGPMKGKEFTFTHKEKLKEAAKFRKKLTCPHCFKIGPDNAMSRWHFNNCKELL